MHSLDRPLRSDFVQQEPSVSFPYKPFDAVCFPAAKKIKGIRYLLSVTGLYFHQCRQPVHSRTQVYVSTDEVNGLETGGIIQHAAPS